MISCGFCHHVYTIADLGANLRWVEVDERMELCHVECIERAQEKHCEVTG